MLISFKNILREIPGITFHQISGHPMAQINWHKMNHHIQISDLPSQSLQLYKSVPCNKSLNVFLTDSVSLAEPWPIHIVSWNKNNDHYYCHSLWEVPSSGPKQSKPLANTMGAEVIPVSSMTSKRSKEQGQVPSQDPSMGSFIAPHLAASQTTRLASMGAKPTEEEPVT